MKGNVAAVEAGEFNAGCPQAGNTSQLAPKSLKQPRKASRGALVIAGAIAFQ
jgi:hypothetical protein